MWYMYELTNDNKWKDLGIKYTETLDSIKYLKWHHDVGFMIYCSYGNAYRLTGNPAYKDVIIETAKSLSSRFRPVAGVIQSWDEDRGWQGTRGWMCPVIIDNMMNLELLFEMCIRDRIFFRTPLFSSGSQVLNFKDLVNNQSSALLV